MTVFWSLATVMMMVALLFVLPPLLRPRNVSAVTRDDLNASVIREQLAELDADLATGKIDQAQFEAARKDLERELLYDLEAGDNGPAVTPVRSGRWLTLLFIPAIPLCAVLLYQLLGTGELIDVLQQAKMSQPAPANTPPDSAHSLDEMAARLAERLRSEPDDLRGWGMLAKTYKVLRRYDDAARAYENVFRLGGGNDPDMLADYADVLLLTNDGEFTDQAGERLLQALELQPDNIKALWLAGHWKNQSAAYAEAIRYWQQAAALLPADGPDAPVIARQIQQARMRLGTASVADEPPAQTSAGTPAPDSPAAALQVHVTLDAQLDEHTSPDDTVFIFARATQGPRMPLAIVRKQVKDLPLTVRLDDSMAMSPAMVLSKFDQVLVGARVSRSGNAMPQSGDLQGSVSPVAIRDSDEVLLTIDSKVP